MLTNNLHFVSIEGNWDKAIHDKRIAEAARILENNKSSLAIASGTYAPSSYSSFFRGKLGEYTKDILINQYGIPAMRIIPAYLFPYSSTYTIIDAYANATLIGWVSCGLRKRNNAINVLFEPITSAFHSLRVETLNNRACRFLHDFNVNLKLSCNNKLPLELLEKDYQEEISRISDMQAEGGLIATGEWLDHGNRRSYDDLDWMKRDLAEAVHSVFDSSFCFDTYALSDLERLVFTLAWNQLANSKSLSEEDIENICMYVESVFNFKLSASEIFNIKRIMNEIRV